MSKTLHVAFVIGNEDRPELAIASLWRSARSAVPEGIELSGTAVFAVSNDVPVESQDGLTIRALQIPAGGRSAGAVAALGAQAGPLGVAGRLLEYNVSSHRLVRALRRDKVLMPALCAADIVVSADPHADWAVWALRKKTAAPLVHGPYAMANALSEMARA